MARKARKSKGITGEFPKLGRPPKKPAKEPIDMCIDLIGELSDIELSKLFRAVIDIHQQRMVKLVIDEHDVIRKALR
jgi:hypothetical protein